LLRRCRLLRRRLPRLLRPTQESRLPNPEHLISNRGETADTHACPAVNEILVWQAARVIQKRAELRKLWNVPDTRKLLRR
jgi:hypothetical protein